MTPEQFEREKNFRVAMTIAKSMLAHGLITAADYDQINGMLIEKYVPIIGSLCR